jgi:hypothetical protein
VLLEGRIPQSVCFLCGGRASLGEGFDEASRSALTVVTCRDCGPYRLVPQSWTAYERLCLAAYVRHENEFDRRSPTIAPTNQELLIRLGDRLRVKKKGVGQ